MNKSLFELLDYKDYIQFRISQAPNHGRGVKKKLARFIGCQAAFVSQVLRGEPDFSLEQGIKINQFLRHTEVEGRYFINLLQYQRAGTEDLKSYFREEIQRMQRDRHALDKRLDLKQVLGKDDQRTYYSSWHFSAIHIAVSIPEFQTVDSLVERFSIPRQLVLETLEFLTNRGLIERDGEMYKLGEVRIHLPDSSPHIRSHHSNWRSRSLHSIMLNEKSDLHYSTVVSMSKGDVPKVKEIFIQAIQDARKVIKDSAEQEVQSICLDFYRT